MIWGERQPPIREIMMKWLGLTKSCSTMKAVRLELMTNFLMTLLA